MKTNELKMKEIEKNNQSYIAEKIFTEKEPRSRVRLDIIKQLQQKIEEFDTIKHKNFIDYEGVERIEGEYYLLTRGKVALTPISTYLTNNSISLSRFVKWIIDIAEVGRLAEKQGFDWKGISLAYLRVDEEGDIKLINPSILKIIEQYRRETEKVIAPENFKPPEVIEGSAWSETGRLYSLGVILYYLITDKPPFGDQDKTDIFDRIITSSVIAPRFINYQISIKLNNLIMKLLAKEKEERIQSWNELIKQLRQLYKKDLVTAPEGIQQENEKKSKRVIKTTRWKEKLHFLFRRNYKLIAIGIIVVLGIIYTMFAGGSPQVVTEETSPRKVVKYFYQAINEKDVVKLDDTTTVDLENLERMVTESYVIEKMKQVYGQQYKDEKARKEAAQKLFGINKLKIISLDSSSPILNFRSEYQFYVHRSAGRKTASMKDKLKLEQIEKRWQIVEIKGDIVRLIKGEFDEF